MTDRKDSKRQNADLANAAAAYSNAYLPVLTLLSSQIDDGVAERYASANWLILRGAGDTTSTYEFFRRVVGYDLAGFFQRHSGKLSAEIELLLGTQMVGQRADLTFKHNLQEGRHGWLRLTPAYSVKLVRQILGRHTKPSAILDPGSGTTGLVCAEFGLPCDLVEINPFLAWLSRAKLYPYTQRDLEEAERLALSVTMQARQPPPDSQLWTPPIRFIERWWPPERLATLARIFHALKCNSVRMVKRRPSRYY